MGYGVLPGRMSVDTEVRLLPGMRREALEEAFAAVLGDVALEWDEPPNDWLPATLVDPAHPLAAAAREACAAALGHVPPDAVFPGTTDATWFAEIQGLPTLPALGPGLLCRAHAADEWVSVAAVHRAVDLYGDLARRFCAAREREPA